MTIQQDVLSAEVPAYIELFEIDLATTNEAALFGSVFRITPMSDSTNLATIKPISFGGEQYIPFPVKITGIAFTSSEAPSRPQLTIANIDKYIGQLAFAYGDVIGATVKYIRTFSTYLNTTQKISLPPVTFFIAKKIVHDKNILSFELRDFTDKERAFMPKRQMLKRDFPGLGINKYVR